MFELEKERGFDEDEEPFTQEIELAHFAEQKAKGFKKPIYFNRVKTGFEWNQYNRVHYDEDNPPPKGFLSSLSFSFRWLLIFT